MSKSPLHPDNLRKRFAELTAQSDAIRAKVDPMREKRDKAIQAGTITLNELKKQSAAILKAEEGLYDIEQERATISRALPGRNVGEPE